MPDKQPFHRDLDVEVWMSEPDFRIGVDEELVSSLESLHEDLYFVTLDFFDALGRTTTRRRLAAPGKIFPIIHPERRGQAGPGARAVRRQRGAPSRSSRCAYTEKGGAKPETGASRSRQDRHERAAGSCARSSARMRSARSSCRSSAKDDREAARAADALTALGAAARARGSSRRRCRYERVDRVAVGDRASAMRARGACCATTGAVRRRRTSAPPAGQADAADRHVGSRHQPRRVRDDRRRSSRRIPKSSAYKAGRSYRGRDVSVMEITLPAPGELVSLAKLTALKPTIFITGRQHANEVSSTSHILRLAELLATDPALPRHPEEGERHPASGGESRRRADGVRPAEADAHAHAARRPLQRARHGRRVAGRSRRSAAARGAGARRGCGRTGCPTSI